MISGTKLAIGSVPLAVSSPTRLSPQPNWKTAVTTPIEQEHADHAGGDQQLDAVAVQGIEGFEFGAVGHEVQPAIGQHTVHVKDRQTYVACPLQQGQLDTHTTPARNRSCIFSAPTGLPA